ncbi:MAG: CDP-alcohol phosphatidyltransferase family protein [Acidimicrobiia bacterium]
MLDAKARGRTDRFVEPIARAAAKTRVTPTVVTLVGLAVTIAGAVLIGAGHLFIGAVAMGVGALLDILDGVLARVTGTTSRPGAFLDTVTDRFGEIVVWAGLAYFLAGERSIPVPFNGEVGAPMLVMLSLVGVSGSLLIPYLRSKAEGWGVDGRGGVMGRAERMLLFGWGVGLHGLGLRTLVPMLWAMAVLTWVTVLQRFFRIWAQLSE